MDFPRTDRKGRHYRQSAFGGNSGIGASSISRSVPARLSDLRFATSVSVLFPLGAALRLSPGTQRKEAGAIRLFSFPFLNSQSLLSNFHFYFPPRDHAGTARITPSPIVANSTTSEGTSDVFAVIR